MLRVEVLEYNSKGKTLAKLRMPKYTALLCHHFIYSINAY